MQSTKVLYLTSILTLSALSGCASVPALPVCPVAPKASPEELAPVPPPEMFSQCLRQIINYGQTLVPISVTCSQFLQNGPTP